MTCDKITHRSDYLSFINPTDYSIVSNLLSPLPLLSFIKGLYGSKFNGYMGVGIAVPLNKYEITDVNITRIADTKHHHHVSKRPSSSSWLWKDLLFIYVWKWWISLWTLLQLQQQQQQQQAQPTATDIWESALSRSNQMVSVRLKLNKRGGAGARRRCFTVSTYHMPCMFKLPQGPQTLLLSSNTSYHHRLQALLTHTLQP